MLSIIISGFAAVLSIIVLVHQFRIKSNLNRLGKCHDGLIHEIDLKIDEGNDILHEIYRGLNETIETVNEHSDVITDMVDTLELGVDTDEMLIDRVIELEDDSAYMWDTLEEYDEILYSIFEDEPEEVEEKKEEVKRGPGRPRKNK